MTDDPYIPDKFSLEQQLEELRGLYKSRHDLVHSRISAGKPLSPSKDLALFSLARLAAAGRTIACLVEGVPIDSIPDTGKELAPDSDPVVNQVSQDDDDEW